MPQISNAPSIPSHNNVFGYEEDVNGNLIRQQNPEKVYTGTFDDTVGPGQYEIKDCTQKQTGTNWHASRVNRSILYSKRNNEIGPGSYNVNINSKSFDVKRSTNNFMSGIQRVSTRKSSDSEQNSEEEELDEQLPGPGHYDPQNNTFNWKINPNQVQQFGLTAARFGPVEKSTTVGPGQYGDLRQAYVRNLINKQFIDDEET